MKVLHSRTEPKATRLNYKLLNHAAMPLLILNRIYKYRNMHFLLLPPPHLLILIPKFISSQEIEHLEYLEETSLSSDLSQGFALKSLTGMF